MALESLTQNANIRDINPTTKRLVERCLSGEWCVHLRKSSFDKDALKSQGSSRQSSPSHDILASTTQAGLQSAPAGSERPHDGFITSLARPRHIRTSRSIENMKSRPTKPPPSRDVRRPSMESATSLGAVASTTTNVPRRSGRSGSMDDGSLLQQAEKNLQLKYHPHLPPSPAPSGPSPTTSTTTQKARRPPPAPPKRRKPPPVPLQTHDGVLFTAIASSSLSAHNQFGK